MIEFIWCCDERIAVLPSRPGYVTSELFSSSIVLGIPLALESLLLLVFILTNPLAFSANVHICPPISDSALSGCAR